MGAFFGVVSKRDVVLDVFFGVDYHSHLGTRCGGMAFYDNECGYQRQIRYIANTPFRTKFEKDILEMKGTMGMGCLSDDDPQPLLVRSKKGVYAISTVGSINNSEDLIKRYFANTNSQFMAAGDGKINNTELTCALINRKDSIAEGILYAQEVIDGSETIMILTPSGMIVARDKMGRLPVVIGKNDDGYCVSFESFAYRKLGYRDFYTLGPQEIVKITTEGIEVLSPAKPEQLRVCGFLWSYYGFPNSNYEGKNVEVVRYRNGEIMARNEKAKGTLPDVDMVAGVPDSGIPHAIGYNRESGKPYGRPFIKYTPTWPRSLTSSNYDARNQISHMKQIPVPELIQGKKLLFVDDSIVRGNQLHETVTFLRNAGAKEIHMRSACPPTMHVCKFLSFSRNNTDMDLLARRIVQELEGAEGHNHLDEYADASTQRGQRLLIRICEKMGFNSLAYQSIDGLLDAIGLDKDKVCTYCWTGKE